MSELISKGWPNQPQMPALPHYRGQKLAVLLLVFCLHGALAWQVLLGVNQPRPKPITPPTIQGVMILSEVRPVLVVPPKPVVKPEMDLEFISEESILKTEAKHKKISIGTVVEVRKRFEFDQSLEIRTGKQTIINISRELAENILISYEA